MVLISMNIRLMARAAQMVWTCSPSSGATPRGKATLKSWAAMGALAASSSASVGVSPTCAALATAVGGPAGATADISAAGVSGGDAGVSVFWA